MPVHPIRAEKRPAGGSRQPITAAQSAGSARRSPPATVSADSRVPCDSSRLNSSINDPAAAANSGGDATQCTSPVCALSAGRQPETMQDTNRTDSARFRRIPVMDAQAADGASSACGDHSICRFRLRPRFEYLRRPRNAPGVVRPHGRPFSSEIGLSMRCVRVIHPLAR